MSAEIPRVVQGSALAAAIEAGDLAEQHHHDQHRALALELEQATYHATLAARRYEAVDPDNRLVAAELEARWNAALERVTELEGRVTTQGRVARQSAPVVEATQVVPCAPWQIDPAVLDTDAIRTAAKEVVRGRHRRPRSRISDVHNLEIPGI